MVMTEKEMFIEIINEANLSNDREELLRLIKEANEITRIMTKAKNSSYRK